MKKGRSDVWTTGICCTNNTDDLRFFFFELDHDDPLFFKHIKLVEEIYQRYRLDFLCHSTGHGIHYLSPTLITKEKWKEFMTMLSGVNPKCPMTTLRWLPNKYPNERDIWFRNGACYFEENIQFNCEEMCFQLNHAFGSGFNGSVMRDLKFVRYPLPYV